MKIHRPVVAVHGHYLCNENYAADTLLLGFHGYSRTAAEFYKHLMKLECAENSCVCALQALHPFYVKQRDHATVGASWMTSFDREQAIIDNNTYVQQVVKECANKRGNVHVQTPQKIIICGFSQGASLVYRSALHLAASGCEVSALIVVGGDVPAELTTADISTLAPIALLRGASDAVYTDEKCMQDQQRLREHELDDVESANCTAVVYEGGHLWNDACVQAIDNFMGNLKP